MTKTFMALCLTATITLAGFTARPAQAADGRDVAVAVLGAITLFAIANEINDRDDKKTKTKVITRNNHYHHHHGRAHSHTHKGAHSHGHKVPRANKYNTRAVPAKCIRDNRYAKGPQRFVTRRCLAEKGYTRQLPSQCAFTYRGKNQTLRSYGVRCLQHKGYRLEARR